MTTVGDMTKSTGAADADPVPARMDRMTSDSEALRTRLEEAAFLVLNSMIN